MIKKLLAAVLIWACGFGNGMFAQNIEWQNTIGGSGGDYSLSLQQTADGGYVLGGTSDSNISGDKTENSNGSYDYWIVKTDTSGNIQWQNTIGGNSADYFHSIQQTTDGGYILGGSSCSDISGDKTENNNGLCRLLDNKNRFIWQYTVAEYNWGKQYMIFFIRLIKLLMRVILLVDIPCQIFQETKQKIAMEYYDYWIVKTDASGNYSMAEYYRGKRMMIFILFSKH